MSRLASLARMDPSSVTAETQDPPVLRFADGIPGFAGAHRFLLSDLTEDGTFQLLTCVEDPELSMVVAIPWLFFPEYAPELPEDDRRELGIDDPTEAVVFCSVTADDDADTLVLNLRAPFIANASTRQARQVILDEDLPLRAPVSAGV
jgi:flagellar assembly factor FliW